MLPIPEPKPKTKRKESKIAYKIGPHFHLLDNKKMNKNMNRPTIRKSHRQNSTPNHHHHHHQTHPSHAICPKKPVAMFFSLYLIRIIQPNCQLRVASSTTDNISLFFFFCTLNQIPINCISCVCSIFHYSPKPKFTFNPFASTHKCAGQP